MDRRGQVTEVGSQLEVVFQLSSGAHGYLEKAFQFEITVPATAFRNVRRDGCTGAARLASESKQFLLWEGVGCGINPKGQLMAPLPNRQLAEILHGPAGLSRFPLFADC